MEKQPTLDGRDPSTFFLEKNIVLPEGVQTSMATGPRRGADSCGQEDTWLHCYVDLCEYHMADHEDRGSRPIRMWAYMVELNDLLQFLSLEAKDGVVFESQPLEWVVAQKEIVLDNPHEVFVQQAVVRYYAPEGGSAGDRRVSCVQRTVDSQDGSLVVEDDVIALAFLSLAEAGGQDEGEVDEPCFCTDGSVSHQPFRLLGERVRARGFHCQHWGAMPPRWRAKLVQPTE